MLCEFDHGTVVLRGASDELLAAVPGIVWDERVGAHRVAAATWPLVRSRLAAGDIPLVPGLEPLPSSLHPPELRPYQRAVLDTWLACGRRGIVVLPTGAGKTRVALAAIVAVGQPALVLVPTRALMAQWVEALAGIGATGVGRLGDGGRTVASLTVATFASAYQHAPGLGDRFGLVIVDEVHHVGGGLRSEPLEMSLAPARLGLTALEPRGRDPARMAELVGPVVFRLAVRDLAASSLAPLRCVGIGLDLTPDERARWMGWMARFRSTLAGRSLDCIGQSWQGVQRVMASTEEGRRALGARRRAETLASFGATKSLVLRAILERHRDERVLVFSRDNASAYRIARENLIAAITCETRPSERRELLSAFGAGEIRALVSARVLDEGLDVPSAAVAVIVGASRNERQHVQRVGRILRPAPGKHAIVYDLFTLGTSEAGAAAGRRRIVAP